MGNDKFPDREESPDWLRTFQTPSKGYYTISSSSPSSSSSLKGTPVSKKQDQGKLNFGGKDAVKREEVDQEVEEGKEGDLVKEDPSILPDEEAAEGQERRIKRVVSNLPIVLGDKIHKSKVLLECEGDALDVSGDVGAVGRVSLSGSHDNEFLLDLKGVIYKATIVPSNTFLVVNVGQSEAKVEAIMNDFVQLQPSANVFETETMIEGTLQGFGFDSDDDKDYAPVAAGLGGSVPDESKHEAKRPKQKERSNKFAKGITKKAGKVKTTKTTTKTGVTKKHVKKTTTVKRKGK